MIAEQKLQFAPIKYDPEHLTVMKNELIRGKQTMSLREAKLIRLLITQVVKEDSDFKTYSIKIAELAEFLDIEPTNLYRDVPMLCRKLLRQVVEIKTGSSPRDCWSMFQWINHASYDGRGTVTFRLSDEIKPYILNLNEYYTQYKLKEVLSLSSFYAIRLYELLKCEYGAVYEQKDCFDFSIAELREFFECEEKYKTTAVFLLKTVVIAVNEINDKTNLWVKTENLMKKAKGNPIVGVRFATMWFPSVQKKFGFVEKVMAADEERKKR